MSKQIDLLLVNPGNRLEQFANLNPLATVAQPLGIAMLASYVRRQGYSVAVIDAEAEFWTPEQTIEEIVKYNPLLIGLSAFTTKMTSAGRILALIRERMPYVWTVIGGHHTSAIPERTLQEEKVDFAVVGEGYYPLVELLKRLRVGIMDFTIKGLWYKQDSEIIGNGRANGIDDLNNLSFPAWDLLPMNKYRAHHWQAWDYDPSDLSGFAVVYTSLGCVYNCDYCSVNVVYGKRGTRYRDGGCVAYELENLYNTYGMKYIEIVDDTFTLNPDKVEYLCDKILLHGLGEQLHIWCFARTDRVNEKLMRKMKKAGVDWVFMGFESGEDEILTGVNKGQTVKQIKEAVDIVHSVGIHVGGNYVFGLPHETQDTMQKTLDLALELNTEYANFFIAMAYPGTRLYEQAKQKGYELPTKWGQYGFFAPDAMPLRTEALTAKEIVDFRDKAFVTYFSNPNYRRMIRDMFGQKIVDYINNQVLSKKIVRVA